MPTDLGNFVPLYNQAVPSASVSWAMGITATGYLNATTDKIALIASIPAGTLTDVTVWSGAGGDNAATLDVRVESVSITDFVQGPGSPSGVLLAAGATGSVSNVGAAAGKHVLSINGGTGVVIPETMLVAFVFSVTGVAPEYRFLMSIDFDWSLGGGVNISCPYWDGVDWRQQTAWMPCWRIGYGGVYPHIPMLPCTADSTQHSWDNANTPNCRGVVMDIPAGTIGGIRMWQQVGNLKTPPQMVVIDEAGVELGRVNQHAYYLGSYHGQHDYFFASPITVTAGRYRIYMIPTNGLTVSHLNSMDFDSAAEARQFVPASINQSYTTAHNPPSEGGVGTWTDDPLIAPLIIPLIKLATGGGGGSVGVPGFIKI